MALYPCPDCERGISEEADPCPWCGLTNAGERAKEAKERADHALRHEAAEEGMPAGCLAAALSVVSVPVLALMGKSMGWAIENLDEGLGLPIALVIGIVSAGVLLRVLKATAIAMGVKDDDDTKGGDSKDDDSQP